MQSTAEALKIYNFRISENGQHVEAVAADRASDDAGQEVHRLTERLMYETGEVNYRTAMHRVLDQNPSLKKVYGS